MMTTMTTEAASSERPTNHSLSAPRAALLQLIPGLASLPVFGLLAWALSMQGVPNIFALALTVLCVEVPVTWAVMVRQVRRETSGQFAFADAFPWFEPLPWWQYLVIGVPLIVFSMIMIAGIGPRVEGVLLQSAFAWVPDWFVMRPDTGMFAALSQGMLLTLWALMFVSMVVIGGVTQELYARAFLLPRTIQLGRLAPVFNALMFAVFHLIAPWSWPVFFVMVLPWAYVVWWRRSARLGIFIHVGMLSLQWLGLTALVFGLVEVRV